MEPTERATGLQLRKERQRQAWVKLRIRNVDLSLFYALDGCFHPDLLLQTRTNAIGRFTFHRVESAKYILATEPGIAGMTFFAGTRDTLKTHVIEVSDGNPLSGACFPANERSPSFERGTCIGLIRRFRALAP